MPDSITIDAPAKINLTLDVTGRRPNGYHDLRMIMQSISLQDTLTIMRTDTPLISLTLDHELPDGLPTEKNLVYRAAALMQERCALSCGFEIRLQKRIPAAAGLAGGSTDCAATLSGINKLCNLSLSAQDLCDIGVTLGADVPFCIRKGTMLSEGIGEVLTPLPDLPPFWVLLLKPAFSVSTAFVYEQFDSTQPTAHPDTDGMMDAIARKDATAIGKGLSNVLESVVLPQYPLLAELKEFLTQNGAVGSLMSGSGPTVYGLYQDEIFARMALRKAKEAYPDLEIHLCQTKG